MEDTEDDLEFHCTQIREVSNLPQDEIIKEIERALKSDEYERVNILLKKRSAISEPQNQDSTVNFVVQNAGKMKTEGSHLSRLLSRLSRYGSEHRNNDPLENMKMNKRFSKQFADHYYIGLYQYNKGNYPTAIQTLQNVKYGTLNKEERAAFSLNLGNCYFKMKDYQKATEIYLVQEYEDQAQKLKAQRLNNLGSCYSKLKKYEKGLRSYTEAIEIYSKYPDFDRSNLLNNIGTLYMAVEMYKSAVKYFSESIQLRKLQNKYANTLTTSYTKMAICLRFDQRYEQAIQNLLIAQNCAERGQSSMLLILKELALCCERLKRWSEALQYYQKLSNVCKGQGYILERVSTIHKSLGHVHECEKFLKLAILEYKKEGNERKVSQLNNGSRSLAQQITTLTL